MSAEHPTPGDLKTIALNMEFEGQTSRAEVLRSAADEWERDIEVSNRRLEDLNGVHEQHARKTSPKIRALMEALADLLEVCHCTNGCAPDDMSCATNRARAALAELEK
jgi:hypothetical protein